MGRGGAGERFVRDELAWGGEVRTKGAFDSWSTSSPRPRRFAARYLAGPPALMAQSPRA